MASLFPFCITNYLRFGKELFQAKWRYSGRGRGVQILDAWLTLDGAGVSRAIHVLHFLIKFDSTKGSLVAILLVVWTVVKALK